MFSLVALERRRQHSGCCVVIVSAWLGSDLRRTFIPGDLQQLFILLHRILFVFLPPFTSLREVQVSDGRFRRLYLS